MSGPSVEDRDTPSECCTLTSSELSDGVTAESGPSVVCELSLSGDVAWLVLSFGSALVSDWMVLIWLELRLRVSSAAPSTVRPVRSDVAELLRSADSADCSVCWDRGCSVIISFPAESATGLVDPKVEAPEDDGTSPVPSLFIEPNIKHQNRLAIHRT